MSEDNKERKVPNEFLRWNIASDKYSWVVQRVSLSGSGKNKGKEVYVSVGWYATLEQACRGAVNLHLKHGMEGEGIDITMGSVINQKLLDKVDDVLNSFCLSVEK